MNRILIADDKEENVYYLQTLLAASGFTVDTARHGAEALVKARQSPPDLVISDLLMPVMDGYTLLRLWKADPRLKQVPFIVYTATYTEPEDERLALSLGADAFILKPAEPEDFLSRVRQVQKDGVAASPPKPREPDGNEAEQLKIYSQTLIRKLEEKTLELEEANRTLLRDIGARKKVEQELQWKTAFLEAQVDSSMDGLLVVDSQGRKILQNHRLNELWKIPPEIAQDNDDARQVQFVAGRTKDPDKFIARVKDMYSNVNKVGRDEIELADGTILERYSSPVRDKNGDYYGRIWAFRDITQQRKLESQFRQSQKMEAFGQLAGGVAHDFNNVLAVIELQASMLKTSDNLSLEQLEIADEIAKAADRAANLTRQLLLFSRKQTMQPRDLNLKELVENMAKMLHRTLGEQIKLLFNFSDEALVVHADPGMIDQILLNLVVNARDAMPKGGQILIETSSIEFDEAAAARAPGARAGLFVCLSVTDTGCGIPPEILPRIFEPFFTTKEVGKGTGLGLATVFGIVEQHKGWISVFSEVGRGTTFRVYLPRHKKSSDTTFLLPSKLPVRGGSETILLVEDELAVRDSVQVVLSRLGYRVLEAANGEEALAVWKSKRAEIRLLLTDLVMPGILNGIELAEKLLAEDPGLKVIYASGYSAETAGKKFPMVDGVNFLAKPFDSYKLAQAVRDSLDKTP